MLQNMPSADFIAKTLGIDQPGVESLLIGNQQGKSYLAQQLTQRGVKPGATLAQSANSLQGMLCHALSVMCKATRIVPLAVCRSIVDLLCRCSALDNVETTKLSVRLQFMQYMTTCAGGQGQGQQARRPPPTQAAAPRAVQSAPAHRPAAPYQGMPAGQQVGLQPAAPQQPPPAQPRPYFNPPQVSLPCPIQPEPQCDICLSQAMYWQRFLQVMPSLACLAGSSVACCWLAQTNGRQQLCISSILFNHSLLPCTIFPKPLL